MTWITPRPQVNGAYTQAMSACVGDTVDFAWDHVRFREPAPPARAGPPPPLVRSHSLPSLLAHPPQLAHNLGAAPKAFFDTCAPALLSTWKRLSPDTNKYSKKVKMAKAGTFYYVCTVTDHCVKGHKIAVKVRKC